MRYYKKIQENYILSIGIGLGGEEISKEEYDSLQIIIQGRPKSDIKGYKLLTDLTWEEYDLPIPPAPSDDDEISDSEALNILLGGGI